MIRIEMTNLTTFGIRFMRLYIFQEYVLEIKILPFLFVLSQPQIHTHLSGGLFTVLVWLPVSSVLYSTSPLTLLCFLGIQIMDNGCNIPKRIITLKTLICVIISMYLHTCGERTKVRENE